MSEVVGGLFFLLFFLLFVAILVWVYRDASQHSPHPALLWTLVVFFAPVLGLVLYLLLGREPSSVSTPPPRTR